MSDEEESPAARTLLVPEQYAKLYLESPTTLCLLLLANVTTVLVGTDFYVQRGTMEQISPLLWPFYTDSPGAAFLMALSLATMLPNLGSRLSDAPQNRPLAYLHTFAFVWLVKYGLWAVIAVSLQIDAYADVGWRFVATQFVHLLFVLQAYLLPHYGRTTRDALAAALAVSLLDVVLDYGFDLHPPLRYEVGVVLPVITLGLSVFAVVAAALSFRRLDSPDD